REATSRAEVPGRQPSARALSRLPTRHQSLHQQEQSVLYSDTQVWNGRSQRRAAARGQKNTSRQGRQDQGRRTAGTENRYYGVSQKRRRPERIWSGTTAITRN